MTEPGEFDELKKNIIDQLTKDGNVWFYFIEHDSPHRSSLLRIEDITCFEIQESE